MKRSNRAKRCSDKNVTECHWVGFLSGGIRGSSQIEGVGWVIIPYMKRDRRRRRLIYPDPSDVASGSVIRPDRRLRCHARDTGIINLWGPKGDLARVC